MTKHLRFLIVLLMTLVWSTGGAQTTIWSEDWTGRKADTQPKNIKYDNVVYSNSNTNTKVYNAKLAGGVAPELLLKKDDTWTVTLSDLKGCYGEYTLSLYTNNDNLSSVKVNGTVVTLSTHTKAGVNRTATFTVKEGTSSLKLEFIPTDNTRIDNVVLTAASTKTHTTIFLGDYANRTFSFTNGKSDDTFTTPTATVTPAAATGAVQYTSSDKDIVTVATNGDLSFTNTKFGSATISAQFIATGDYANSNTVTYTVVNKEPQKTATEVTFGDKSQQTITLTEGDVTGVVFPKASEKNNIAGTISYESSNTDVAVVDAEGNVTVKGAYGEATITATFTPTEAETYAVSTDWYKVVNKVNAAFYESFDKCAGKGGNDGTFSGLSGGTGLSSTYTDNEGWNSIKGFVASKCVRFGTRDDAGSATTPSITVTGKGVLSFMAAAWNKDDENITVSVSDGATLTYNGKTSSSISVNMNMGSWTNIDNIEISGAKTFTITFAANGKNNRFFLDEVMVKDIPTVTLDETATNNTIEAKTGVNVTLKRTMVANEWNTICLPFDVTMDKAKAAFGDNVKIVELDTKAAVDANVLSFKASTGIVAATPYLIKPSAVSETGTYTFDGVDITETNDEKAYSFNNVKNPIAFKGIYNMVDITNDVTTNIGETYYAAFLGDGNKIYKAGTGKTKGFRAYFAIPNGTATSALRVNIDGTATSIKSINSEVVESNAPVYNLQGQRVDGNNLTPGIYVKAGKKFVVK